MDKIIVGATELVSIHGNGKLKRVRARIDTGASRSSVDKEFAKNLKTSKTNRKILIKSASGNSMRPLIKLEIELAGKKLSALFTVANRSHLKYPVLIGRNILKRGFLIDPSK